MRGCLGKVARGGPESCRKRRSWKEVFRDVIRGAPQRKVLRRGSKRSHERMSYKKSWDKADKGGCKMSEEKSLHEVLGGGLVSGGPQKRLREEVGEAVARESRGRRPERKSSQEVAKGVPKDVAREKLWKTKLREEAVRRGPNRSHILCFTCIMICSTIHFTYIYIYIYTYMYIKYKHHIICCFMCCLYT